MKTKLIILISSIITLGFLMLLPSLKASKVEISSCSSSNYLVRTSSKTISCYTTYNEALKDMMAYDSKINDVAYIYYNNKILTARYAIAQLNGNQGTVNLYDASGNKVTYIHGQSATDAQLIEYDPSRSQYKIRISGMTAYIASGAVKVVPLTSDSAATDTSKTYYRVTASPNLRLRDKASTSNSTVLSLIPTGSIVELVNSKTTSSEGLLWYQVKYNGVTGYVGSDPSDPYLVPVSNTPLLDTYYSVNTSGDLIHKFAYGTAGYTSSYNIGPAPKYLKQNVRYYSFDGIYFYTDILAMLDDGRTNSHTSAINKYPYYGYYLYLPYRTKSNVSYDDMNQYIASRGYTIKADRSTYYEFVLNNTSAYVPGIEQCNSIADKVAKRSCINNKRIATGLPGKWVDATPDLSRPYSGESVMVGEGANFLSSQSKYGANALLTFGIAINESGWGTSWISIRNNNIFGHAAYDSDPDANAAGYSSVGMGIEAHANSYVSDGYCNPQDSRYTGCFAGNKGSGMNVNYASDPYWGEKATSNYYSVVREKGINDYKQYQIGIKQAQQNVSVYKGSSTASGLIYNVTKYGNIPFIVLETVKGQSINGNDTWYKVQTEPSLNQNGTISSSGVYSYQNSVGYIHSSYLYVEEEAPMITASNQSIYKNSSFNALTGVSAYDAWDGDLTSKIKVTGSVNPSVPGKYDLTYEVTDSENHKTTKKIVVNVVENPSPVLNVSDIKVYKGDKLDLRSKVTATDAKDGDITAKVVITPSSVDTSIVGTTKVIYQVTNSSNLTTTKEITVTVLDNSIKSNGSFGLESLKYNSSSKTIDIKGYLSILSINNTLSQEISYSFILKDSNGREFVKSLDRWTIASEFPFQIPSENGKNYQYSWFKGSLDLKDIPEGDYTVTIKASGAGYQAESTLRDIFFKENSNKLDKKITIDGRGYLFRRNYLDRTIPLQLFIRDQGLISSVLPPTIDNMFNTFYNLAFQNGKLYIKGTSHSVKGNYAESANVKREIILENQSTFDRKVYSNVGSITNGPYTVTLNVSDGFSKTRAWFETSLDLSTLEKGTYAIYIHTTSGSVDDYGEMNDISFRTLPPSITLNGKTYTLKRNNEKRLRIELVVS